MARERATTGGSPLVPEPRRVPSLLERLGLVSTERLPARPAPERGNLVVAGQPYARLRALPRDELRRVRKRQRQARQAQQAAARAHR